MEHTLSGCVAKSHEMAHDNPLLPVRAATFTCVNGTVYVSAVNVYKIDIPLTRTFARDQRRGLLIAFHNEK